MNPITTALAAIVGTSVVLCGFYEFKRVPEAVTAERNTVLIEVKDNQIRAALKAEEDRRTAQEKISRIEAGYVAQQNFAADRTQELEAQIAQYEKGQTQNDPNHKDDCPSPVGLPVELRNAVNRVGSSSIPGYRATVPAGPLLPARRTP